jgi:hypothetical protein
MFEMFTSQEAIVQEFQKKHLFVSFLVTSSHLPSHLLPHDTASPSSVAFVDTGVARHIPSPTPARSSGIFRINMVATYHIK